MKTLAIWLALTTAAMADFVVHIDIVVDDPIIDVTYQVPTIPPVEDWHRLGARGTFRVTDDLQTLVEHSMTFGHDDGDGMEYFPFDWNPGPQDLGGLELALVGGTAWIRPNDANGMRWVLGASTRSYFFLTGSGPYLEQIHPFGIYRDGELVNSHPFREYSAPFELVNGCYPIGTYQAYIPEPSCVPMLLAAFACRRRRR